MSVKIKKLTGELFDLPEDFVIESEKNSPQFSEKGSQTVPVTFPATPHNRRLLDATYRFFHAIAPVDHQIDVSAEGETSSGGRRVPGR